MFLAQGLDMQSLINDGCVSVKGKKDSGDSILDEVDILEADI
jgi:hypothetical protein